ncbi:hypothetical protein DFJ73DRAFT_757162 [Zopfochytrium polystomum]|nr:hypothetical protein DFJ73DRAFT_757162 [Zopfochytrium polystomum]
MAVRPALLFLLLLLLLLSVLPAVGVTQSVEESVTASTADALLDPADLMVPSVTGFSDRPPGIDFLQLTPQESIVVDAGAMRGEILAGPNACFNFSPAAATAKAEEPHRLSPPSALSPTVSALHFTDNEMLHTENDSGDAAETELGQLDDTSTPLPPSEFGPVFSSASTRSSCRKLTSSRRHKRRLADFEGGWEVQIRAANGNDGPGSCPHRKKSRRSDNVQDCLPLRLPLCYSRTTAFHRPLIVERAVAEASTKPPQKEVLQFGLFLAATFRDLLLEVPGKGGHQRSHEGRFRVDSGEQALEADVISTTLPTARSADQIYPSESEPGETHLSVLSTSPPTVAEVVSVAPIITDPFQLPAADSAPNEDGGQQLIHSRTDHPLRSSNPSNSTPSGNGDAADHGDLADGESVESLACRFKRAKLADYKVETESSSLLASSTRRHAGTRISAGETMTVSTPSQLSRLHWRLLPVITDDQASPTACDAPVAVDEPGPGSRENAPLPPTAVEIDAAADAADDSASPAPSEPIPQAKLNPQPQQGLLAKPPQIRAIRVPRQKTIC